MLSYRLYEYINLKRGSTSIGKFNSVPPIFLHFYNVIVPWQKTISFFRTQDFLTKHNVLCWILNVVRCAIWYNLYNLQIVKNTHKGVLILVMLQAAACNFTKINTPPWVFFMIFKLYKWNQIAQRTTNKQNYMIKFLS